MPPPPSTPVALHEGPVHGWTAPATIVGVLAAVAFLMWELRQVAPLLHVVSSAHEAWPAGRLAANLIAGGMAPFDIKQQPSGRYLFLGPTAPCSNPRRVPVGATAGSTVVSCKPPAASRR